MSAPLLRTSPPSLAFSGSLIGTSWSLPHRSPMPCCTRHSPSTEHRGLSPGGSNTVLAPWSLPPRDPVLTLQLRVTAPPRSPGRGSLHFLHPKILC